MTARISQQLREQYNDLAGLYDEAKIAENTPLMEKLIKSMSGLAKQIKEHELYENETLRRDDIKRFANRLGTHVGRAIKSYFPDDERADLVIDQIVDDVRAMAASDE